MLPGSAAGRRNGGSIRGRGLRVGKDGLKLGGLKADGIEVGGVKGSSGVREDGG